MSAAQPSPPLQPASKPRRRHGVRRAALLLAAALLAGLLALYGRQRAYDPGSDTPAAAAPATPQAAARQISHGAYLARAANCMACHTARGGAAYAGGRAIATPFGQLFAPNITPERTYGIGAWDADAFWRALHNGKSRDGSFLYPAFPYTAYTNLTRADSDALYAYLRTVPPVAQPNAPHALRFPYDQRFLLAVWRALYFRVGNWQPQPERSPQWNRGAYLVEGAGHCSACHAARNPLGATRAGAQLGGGLIDALDWYAPSLSAADEASVAHWPKQDVIDLLQAGVSRRGSVFGPMAEVVAQSLQYLDTADVDAMATYLQALPGSPPAAGSGGQAAPASASVHAPAAAADPATLDPALARGAALYRTHCIDCHGADGRGAPPAYPPLAGNQALLMTQAVNPIRMVLNGGFAPATAGNPRPYGMPPFGPLLDDAEVAAVVSYLRASWGNAAPRVSSEEVGRYRAVPVE